MAYPPPSCLVVDRSACLHSPHLTLQWIRPWSCAHPHPPIHTHRGPAFGIVQLGQSVLLSGFLLSSTFRGPVCDPVCSIPPVPCSESIRGVVPPPLLFNIKLICEFVFLPPPVPQYICPMALSHTCAHTIFQWISLNACIHSSLLISLFPSPPSSVD